jgi:hypothetical protein
MSGETLQKIIENPMTDEQVSNDSMSDASITPNFQVPGEPRANDGSAK